MSTSSLQTGQNALSFTQEEDFNLLRFAYDYKSNFDESSKVLGSKHTQKEYIERYKELQEPKIASWTEAENIKLKEYVEIFGDHKWSTVASLLPGRNSKQCRDHYINQLAPNIIKGRWTAEEDKKILDSSRIFGTSWTKIRSQLPNRSELDIKNRYNKLIRELIDKGRIPNIDEIIEEALNNPKVNKNIEEAENGFKSLNLKLEITPEILKMQNKMKRSPESVKASIPFGTIIKSEDLIRKVNVSPYENVLLPVKTSDIAQVLAEEVQRHQKLQKYALNPYDIFKVRNFNRVYVNPVSTKKYSPDINNKMFSNVEIPIPNDTTTTISSTNSNISSESMTDPLLPLFQSSTATSLSSFPSSSFSTNHNLTKRRKQIEINPYIIDWFCPYCGNKNDGGSIECKFNKCNFLNPYINKYEQQLHIQRLQHQLLMLQRQQEEQQQQLLAKQNNNNKKSRDNGRNKKVQKPRQFYHIRQTLSDNKEEVNNNNNNFSQQEQEQEQEQEQQIYFDISDYNSSDNDNIIPYPYQLLEHNLKTEDGTLKPWYCPICSSKNDLLQDECNVCHSDNPNRYVNINGKIVKKFTLSNIETPLMYLPPPPPPEQPIPEDIIMNWICPNCGIKNDNSINICMKCNKPKPNEQLLVAENTINNGNNINSWSCIYCHYKNKNQNDICENCQNERSYAFQSIDGDDDDDDVFYGYNDNIRRNTSNTT